MAHPNQQYYPAAPPINQASLEMIQAIKGNRQVYLQPDGQTGNNKQMLPCQIMGCVGQGQNQCYYQTYFFTCKPIRPCLRQICATHQTLVRKQKGSTSFFPMCSDCRLKYCLQQLVAIFVIFAPCAIIALIIIGVVLGK